MSDTDWAARDVVTAYEAAFEKKPPRVFPENISIMEETFYSIYLKYD